MESSTLTVWGLLLCLCLELLLPDCRGLAVHLLIVTVVASSLLAEKVLLRWFESAGGTIRGWEKLF